MPQTTASDDLLNDLRDFMETEVAEIAVGTGTSSPTKTDDALDNEVFSKTVGSTSKASQEVTHIMRIGTAEANGNDLSEAGDKDANNNLEDRFTFSALAKTSDIEVEIRTTKKVVNA